MGTITHKAGRVAVGKAADVVIKNLDKDRERDIKACRFYGKIYGW